MKAIVIPVKEFTRAKTRLIGHFSLFERAALARALCRDFFGVASRVRRVDRIFVVSKEQEALALAKQAGWETIPEAEQTSESASIFFASRHCAGLGVKALLRIPTDIPLAQPSDIEALFDRLDAAPSAVIVPSGDGTGTNALLRNPPLLFPSRFGPSSFALHIEEARAAGAPMRIVRNGRIEQDVDEIDDLKRIARFMPPDSETGKWLAGHFTEIGSPPQSRAAAAPAD